MIIENARQAENNISADNIFYVYDDNYKPIGKATTYTFENYTSFDEFPTNFYFDIHKSTVNDEARALLLGAVLAKGYLYSANNPQHSTKIYTNIDPHDSASIHFFTNSGMQFGECEEELLLNPPPSSNFNAKANNCTVEELKLQTVEDIAMLCNRMNQYLLSPISREKMIQIAQSGTPIKVLVTKYQNTIISELAFYVRDLKDDFGRFGEQPQGTKEAVLIGLYTHPTYRRYGVASNLLGKAYRYLNLQNIYFFRCKLQRRSRAQKALAGKCRARSLGITYYCPRLEEIKNHSASYTVPMSNACAPQATMSHSVQPAQTVASTSYVSSVSPSNPEVQAQPSPAITNWNDLYKQAYSTRRSKK